MAEEEVTVDDVLVLAAEMLCGLMEKHGVKVDTTMTPSGEIFISLIPNSDRDEGLTARYTQLDLMRDIRASGDMHEVASDIVSRVLDGAEEQIRVASGG